MCAYVCIDTTTFLQRADVDAHSEKCREPATPTRWIRRWRPTIRQSIVTHNNGISMSVGGHNHACVARGLVATRRVAAVPTPHYYIQHFNGISHNLLPAV